MSAAIEQSAGEHVDVALDEIPQASTEATRPVAA